MVGTKSFECARMEGDEIVGGKKIDAVRWWSAQYPLGPIKSARGENLTEAVRTGEDWNRRPPFPS